MSLFQCEQCGCCENTALASQGCNGSFANYFDWTGIEDRKGKRLCSVCAPTKHEDGTPTEFGKWHDEFDRTFLPMGEFFTNDRGNLQHRKTGSEDFRAFAITGPDEKDRAP